MPAEIELSFKEYELGNLRVKIMDADASVDVERIHHDACRGLHPDVC